MKKLFFLCSVATMSALLGCVSTSEQSSHLSHTETARSLPTAEKITLSNGLQVVLHEDHSAPIVALVIRYKVGSVNEKRGATGLAHLLEHMMFKGTKHHPKSWGTPLTNLGARGNATTTSDTTSYHEVFPKNALETALWLEAERMGFLEDALSAEKLDLERDAVKNERRGVVDNRPYGKTVEVISEAMFPPDHPYNWIMMGSLEDLDVISIQDLKSFYHTYYAPNNATLCLVGDFDSAEVKRLIEKYFGGLPPRPEPLRVQAWYSPLVGEKRATMFDRVTAPRLYVVFPSVEKYHADEPPLRLLASIMSERLNRALVKEKQIAQRVTFSSENDLIAGLIEVTVTPRDGISIADAEKALLREIETNKNKPPTTAELSRVKTSIEIGQVGYYDTLLGKAARFSSYNLLVGSPNYGEQDLQRFFNVTAADVTRVAQKYLGANRFLLTVAAQPDFKESDDPEARDLDRTKAPSVGAFPLVKLPPMERFKLSNGLQVMAVEREGAPLVNFRLIIKSGSDANPTDKAGLATMTVEQLRHGTKKRSTEQISDDLRDYGIAFSASANWNGTELSLRTLTKHLDVALDIFTDSLLHPTFSQAELERARQARLAAFAQQRASQQSMAGKATALALYGVNHPYGFPADGAEESVKSLHREDLQWFHQTFYRPNNAILIVVGDMSVAELRPKLEKVFAAWKPAAVPKVEMPAPTPAQRLVVLGDKPEAAQSRISIAHIGPARNLENYFALQLANNIISTRLNANIRGRKGFAYGAGSGFDFRSGSSLFGAGSNVQTQSTAEALHEMLKELKLAVGEKPITESEFNGIRTRTIRAYVMEFESAGQVMNRMAESVRYNLPNDYFDHYIDRLESLTVEDVRAAAKKYLEPSQSVIIVVGDLKRIEKDIRELNLGEIRYMDADGRFVVGVENK